MKYEQLIGIKKAMDENVRNLIRQAVENVISKNSSAKKIDKIRKTHDKKVHFIPVQYRVFSGLLQSMNIQFGNFIEEMLHLIIQNERSVEVVDSISGKKNVKMPLSAECDSLIDSYITKCQNGEYQNLERDFQKLLQDIISTEESNANKNISKHDIDVLFKSGEVLYYLEIKYNDDHDTGKFVDINRKFIKTFAALTNVLGVENQNKLIPILYYFNSKKMKGNIYVDEANQIYRGAKLFDKFFTTKYSQIDEYLKNISYDEEIIKMFDDLYEGIRNKR